MFAPFLSEIIALLAVFALGYYMLLDSDPGQWWRDQLRGWAEYCRSKGLADQNIVWLLAVGLPALLVGLIDVSFNHDLVHLVICMIVLLLGMKVTSFMRYRDTIIKAVYANDDKLAMSLANQWEGRTDGLEDGRNRFAQRMLGLCARRLSEDIIASLVWFTLLGPAGVVLATANNVFFAMSWAKPVKLNPLVWLTELCSALLFGISGNMGRVLQARSLRPEMSALRASNIDPEHVDLEAIPPYGKMLHRAMLAGVIVAVVILF